jgi:hypothetical protein
MDTERFRQQLIGTMENHLLTPDFHTRNLDILPVTVRAESYILD